MRVDKQQNLTICCLYEIPVEYKNIGRLKAKGWKMIYHANTNHNKAGVAKIITDKVEISTMRFTGIMKDIM